MNPANSEIREVKSFNNHTSHAFYWFCFNVAVLIVILF